jgi:hypothetical protein
MTKFNRTEYLQKLGEIVIVPHKNVEWGKQRKQHIYSEQNNPVTTHTLREVGKQELILEFDSTKKETPIIQIQKEANKWISKIKEFLNKYEYHQTEHGGKSPHIRLLAHGLEILPFLERRLYKEKFAQGLLKKIGFSSTIIKLDMGLLTSKHKLVSLEEQPHFKPKYNGTIEEITHYNQGQPFKPKEQQIEIIIKHSRKDRTPIQQITIEEINTRVINEWWEQHYKVGQRNDIILAFAGMCRKTGMTEEQTIQIIKNLHKITHTENDYEDEQQYRKIANTYAHELKDVAVYGLLGKVYQEEQLAFTAQKLYSGFVKADTKLWNTKDLLCANIPPIQWLIPEMIEENGYHIVAGKPGEFKSYLTLFMAKALVTGGVFLDRKVSRPCRVLYMDEESRIQRIKTRLHKMMSDIPMDVQSNLSFSIGKGTKFTHEHIQILINDIEQFKPDVVFMDSLSRFFAGNENDSKDVKMIFNEFIKPILVKYNTAIVIIHHYNKSNDKSGGDLLRGSSELQAQIDGFMAIKKKNRDKYSIAMPKTRDSASAEPIEFEVVDKDDGTLNILFTGRTKIDNRSATEKQADFVMEKLHEMDLNDEFQGNVVISRINAKGYSHDIMRKALSTLVKQERLERIKNGWFKILEEQFEEME